MESMEDRDGRRERGSRLATRLFRGWESQGLSCPFQSDTDRSPFAELFSSVYWCKWREMAWFREWQFVPFNQQTPSLPLLSYFSGDVWKWIRDQGDCHDRPCWNDDQRGCFFLKQRERASLNTNDLRVQPALTSVEIIALTMFCLMSLSFSFIFKSFETLCLCIYLHLSLKRHNKTSTSTNYAPLYFYFNCTLHSTVPLLFTLVAPLLFAWFRYIRTA